MSWSDFSVLPDYFLTIVSLCLSAERFYFSQLEDFKSVIFLSYLAQVIVYFHNVSADICHCGIYLFPPAPCYFSSFCAIEILFVVSQLNCSAVLLYHSHRSGLKFLTNPPLLFQYLLSFVNLLSKAEKAFKITFLTYGRLVFGEIKKVLKT